ncbi:MAG: TIGR00730 family Rossman fold protein [Gemmatales bacterium]|nr:TIGR00730 family Rossman fold protein [Gemmatales bacterium]MDW7995266.1 TIGR00730 family Rossman fold protein [Gemmatales bacterium]
MTWHFTVYCGSRSGKRPEYAEAARQLGRVLAEKGVTLIYGGGHVGLMGVLADEMLCHGGTVIGIIPESLVESELAHTGLKELHIVPTMHARKALMAQKADAFLALPGGYGTVEEFFEMVTWRLLKLHYKPIGLFNVAGYYDALLAWIEHAFAEDFIAPKYRELFFVESDATRLVERLLEAVRTNGGTETPSS